MHETLDFLASNGGKNFFTVEHSSYIGKINQLIGGDILGAGGSHVIGVDVVELIVRANAEAGSDRQQIFAPERLDERKVQAGEVAHEAEAACDFIVNHWFGTEGLRIGGGNTNCRLPFSGNGGGELLIEQTGEDHDGSVARLLIGDAQAADELALDTHAFERGCEKPAAAVNDKDFMAFTGECGDLASERTNNDIVLE